jgi:hypothetical protein
MILTNWGVTKWLSDVSDASPTQTYQRVIVESAADEAVRVLDARLKHHPWRGDRVEIEIRWTCERLLKIRV